MANTKQVAIYGEVPFDIAGQPDAQGMWAYFAGPVSGLRIRYGAGRFVPNEELDPHTPHPGGKTAVSPRRRRKGRVGQPQPAAATSRAGEKMGITTMTSTEKYEVICYTPNGREIRRNNATGKYEVQPRDDNYWIECDSEEAAYRAYHPDWDGENH